ncbi:MAG TPA: tetratricopeptide repeat protein [Streptosporangiaceae bacterium]|nr:tetratricopeptide repeat protein [Streptosporangiaceae bacterium]
MGPGPAREPQGSTFAGLLRQLRIGAGLTQEQLATAAGLSPRSISDLERGVNQTARRETVRLLADVLKLTGPARAAFQAAARGLTAVFPAGGAATATRTLPRDIGAFTGRQPELRAVVRLAGGTRKSGGVVGICAIGGMAGIGKTAFAIHAAHQLAPRYPDGQIFMSLHAHTPGQRPVDAASALASLLITAGVDSSQIPSGVEERSRLWRDHLAGRQVLLLLDDVAGYEQVKPLLPGAAGSLVLITSRRHLTALDDACSISLDTMQPPEAAELLIRLSGRPGLSATPAMGEITQMCGYLPLAIGMMAGRLRHHPAWSVADLAADLASARDRLDLMRTEDLSVAAAFDLSYQDLEPAVQRLFRRLALHGGTDIDVCAAAALDDADVGTTRARLEALYDQHLIAEHAAGRYRLHDLMREHARSLAAADPASERSAAADRLMAYYLRAARAADVHLARRDPVEGDAPVFPAREDAIEWMERERLNLDALIMEAVQRGRPAVAVELAAAMHAFLRFRGHWDHALELHKVALDASAGMGDERAEARALTNLGDMEMAARDYPAAATTLSKAVQACRNLLDRPGEAGALTQLGAALYLTGDHQTAAEHLGRALELFRELGDRSGEALALSRLGSVQIVTGDYAAAGAGLGRAFELYRQLGDRLGEAYALNDLGAVRQATGMYHEATADLERALEIYIELGDRLGEVNALLDLASVQQATCDYAAALAGLTSALELSNALDDRLRKANALHKLGCVQQATGDSQAARQSQRSALELYRQLRDRSGEADALAALAEIELESGRPAEARAFFEQAQTIAVEIASPLVQAGAIEGLGRCELLAGRSGAAALTEALAIYRRIGAPRADVVAQALDELGTPGL